MVGDLRKSQGFDSVQVDSLPAPGRRSISEGEVRARPLLGNAELNRQSEGVPPRGSAESMFCPLDSRRKWSGTCARPWASIPSRWKHCQVPAAGPHRREKETRLTSKKKAPLPVHAPLSTEAHAGQGGQQHRVKAVKVLSEHLSWSPGGKASTGQMCPSGADKSASRKAETQQIAVRQLLY